MDTKTVSTKFSISGDNVFPYRETKGSVVDKIPAAYYTVEFHPMMGFYLTRKSDVIALPEKIYGSTQSRSERCWKQYDKNPDGTCIGLFGTKGAGKTLLTNYMAQEAINRGMPVIDVSSSFVAQTEYMDFINSLGEIFIIFDEFLKRLSKTGNPEKESSTNYQEKQRIAHAAQESMLTFLQGTNNSRRFLVMVDNSSNNLSEFLHHRPGRMYYIFNYATIEISVVESLCADAGLSESKTELLTTYSQLNNGTFDTIKTIIDEWVAYPDESLEEITECLNVPAKHREKKKEFIVTMKGDHPVYKIEPGIICNFVENTLYVPCTMKNDLCGTEPISEEAYDENEDLNELFYNYQEYVTRTNSGKEIETILHFHQGHLISVTNTKRAYKKDNLIIEAHLLSDTIYTTGKSYFSDDSLF